MSQKEQQIVEEPTTGYQRLYTYTDYLKFDFEYMVELIRGVIYKMTPAPNSWHQEILGDLHVQFRKCFEDHPCKVYLAPFDVVLPVANEKRETATTVVQPDLCIICDLDQIDKAGCTGAPDLVVEIISPHTSKKDIKHKFEVYEQTGVREYWVVFPEARLLQVFVLKNGSYDRAKSYTHTDEVTSDIFPNLNLDLSGILQDFG